MCELFFKTTLEYDAEATAQLQQAGSGVTLQAVLEALDSQPLTAERAAAIVQQVTKTQNVKKGLIMRGLRAALMGTMHGPDLMQSWLLLHHKAQDRPRIQQALTIAQ
jgi:glutamyl-tRNA synthetase